MIKIESQEDLTKLDIKKVNPLITAYIKKHFLFVCRPAYPAVCDRVH